jgi:hypothetical protein
MQKPLPRISQIFANEIRAKNIAVIRQTKERQNPASGDQEPKANS